VRPLLTLLLGAALLLGTVALLGSRGGPASEARRGSELARDASAPIAAPATDVRAANVAGRAGWEEMRDRGSARLAVRVVDAERGGPVFGERVVAERAGGAGARVTAIDGGVARLGESPRTDVAGEAVFLLPAGAYEVRNARGDTRVAVELAGDEERAVELSIAPTTVAFHALVRGPDGAPVAGARLAWSGSRDEATSGADGTIVSRAWRLGGERGLVTAAGLAPVAIEASDAHATADAALVVRLAGAVDLAGAVRGADGGPLPGVAVVARAEIEILGATDLTKLEHRGTLTITSADLEDFGAAAFTGTAAWRAQRNREHRWTARTASGGAYRLRDLPAGARVTVDFAVDADEPSRRFDLRLPWTGVERLDVVLGARTRVAGRVAHVGGAPWAGLGLRLGSRSDEAERLAYTDADGGFAFDAVPVGSWTLSGKAASRALAGEGELPFQPVDLVVRGAERELALALVARRGGAVSGTVVDANGAPLGDVPVQARGADGKLLGLARTQTDGAFRIAAVPEGPVHLVVPGGNFGGEVAGEAHAWAGDEGVVVRCVSEPVEGSLFER
jgi:hypothetical protein